MDLVFKSKEDIESEIAELEKEAASKYEEVLSLENASDMFKLSLDCDHNFICAGCIKTIGAYTYNEYRCEKCGIHAYDKDSKEKFTL